jgi:hypothetical protein
MSQNTISNTLNYGLDTTTDLIEKIISPSARAGSVINRAGVMNQEGVDSEVIALQMTKGSFYNQEYTERDVEAYIKLHKESRTGVNLTAKQARVIITDHRVNNASLLPSSNN